MKRFWVEFEEPQAVRGIAGGYFLARNELGLRLFWTLGKIIYAQEVRNERNAM